MELKIDVSTIQFHSKEELWEFLKSIQYLPELISNSNGMEAATRDIGKMEFHNSALPWDLIDLIIEKHFDNVIGLRSANPDLCSRLRGIADYFEQKSNEIDFAKESIERHNEDNTRSK